MNRSLPIAATLPVALVLLAGCERPPIDTVQRGYRGLGMVHVENPRLEAAKWAANQAPAASAAVPQDAPKAKEVFKNVQVLGDLPVTQFTRLMTDMTQWVGAPPEQGCLYCHDANDLSADTRYTKKVARRMLEMTQALNSKWKVHTGATGVTCYTCHRGQAIPTQVFYPSAGDPRAQLLTGARDGVTRLGDMALPRDPLGQFLAKPGAIPVIAHDALPTGPGATIQATEATYSLMIHVSRDLGVNCTFCHNSRSFASWEASTPMRVTAWHGLRMVRDLNTSYLAPLKDTLPGERLSPTGDAPLAQCGTCHRGVNKPLFGTNLVASYPELMGAAK